MPADWRRISRDLSGAGASLVAARLGILDEQRGHLAGAIGHILGEPPFLEDLEVPDGMGVIMRTVGEGQQKPSIMMIACCDSRAAPDRGAAPAPRGAWAGSAPASRRANIWNGYENPLFAAYD